MKSINLVDVEVIMDPMVLETLVERVYNKHCCE